MEAIQPESASARPSDDPESGAAAVDGLIADSDMDSLFVLPLSIIPLETEALRPARMVKNMRLESVVEFFNDRESGSGQMDIEKLGTVFGWDENAVHPDYVTLARLARMRSYDVYSLRILLREAGIPIQDNDALRLSDEKASELGQYMKDFTQPLVREIYGDEAVSVDDASSLIDLFRDPDVQRARERLEVMANKLEIEVLEVPRFLEDYGDIFLSLAYYKQCLDRIAPTLSEFMQGMEVIRENWQLRNDPGVMAACDFVEGTINELTAEVTGHFESFDRSSRQMWDNISAEVFRRVEEMIRSYHTGIGGVLCGLAVKMHSWHQRFPDPERVGPIALAEFVSSEMKQGLERIEGLDQAGPVLATLNKKA